MTTTTDQPWPRKRPALFRGLTQRQLDTLVRIAVNDDSCLHPQRVAAFLARGLIRELREPRGGGSVVFRYEMPTPVHMAWRAWCAETVGEDESDE